MWHPFRKPPPAPPRVIKRIEELEIRANDLEDTIEKVLYQQTRMMGKLNARHKKTLQAAEEALEAASTDPTAPHMGNEVLPFRGDPKAELRARARELRSR